MTSGVRTDATASEGRRWEGSLRDQGMPLQLRSCAMGWSEYQKESKEYAWNAPAEEPEELRCSRSPKATPRARHASARTAKRIDPVPVDLKRRLLPPPEGCGCKNVFIGSHVVLLNTNTNYVYSVFHFEIQ